MDSTKQIRFNQRIMRYFYWPITYLVALLVMSLIMFSVKRQIGIALLAVWFLLVIFGFIMNRFIHKYLLKEVVNFAISYSGIQKGYMKEFALANIVVDNTGKIRWVNEAFTELVNKMDVEHEVGRLVDKNINSIIPGINHELLPSEVEDKTEKFIDIDGRVYNVLIKHMRVEWSDLEPTNLLAAKTQDEMLLYGIYFFDVTQEKALERKNEEEKGVVALVYIDNFEEVLNSIEDVRRPLLVALIDRNLNKFAKKIDGVIKKFEKDKYVIVFQRKYMAGLKENKFGILDDIREIDIGNELPVTMSIGVGINDFSYLQSVEFARMAIDLALGRGGDQAVVKKNDRFSFYGGKTRGVEKSTRVKARIKAYAFRELIEESDRLIIMGHKRQDLDSLGAAVGVYACAKMLEKPANIVINDVTSSVKALHSKLIEEESYPKDLFVTGQEAISYVNEKTLLIVVDVNRPTYTEYEELFSYVKNVVVFDHHRVSSDPIENPVLSYIEPYASSTCEMVTEILRYISEKVKLEPIEADALFAGIMVDTKNFVIKTGVKTFEAAAFLKRSGADVIRVKNFFKNDMASYKAKATAVRDCNIYRDTIALSICPSDVDNPSLISAQAADELLNISGIKASFVLSDIDGVIYISARSLDTINVQIIMEQLGGGGHLSVAGAQLEEVTMEEAIERLKAVIDTYVEDYVDKE